MVYTYKQETKNIVRHAIIRKAVEILTTKRSDACCVRHSYVRDLYEHFSSLQETHEQEEASKIDTSYIREWERMHTNSTGMKRPDELSVCYLSGPEPENDFLEFVSLGVLPQNIWAFECEKETYLQALKSVDGSTYIQPKIIKASIENFFKDSPKTFDIVYIDACASLVSSRHALRCVSSLFQNHRLNSPGVLISNFAFLDIDNDYEKNQYADMITRYNLIRKQYDATLYEKSGTISFQNDYCNVQQNVTSNLEDAYGNFITAMICNAASITIPTLRFCNSNYLQTVSSTTPTRDKTNDLVAVNTIKNNTLYKYLAMNCLLNQRHADFPGISKVNTLAAELSGAQPHYDLLSSTRTLYEIRNSTSCVCINLREAADFFDNSRMLYQFLDKPNRILLIDAIINQLSYPMHYAADKALRFTYVAKTKRMFTDLMLFDECRYIYDWLPTVDQIAKSFSNPCWQYTFRFALDGLIKQRINYNDEFFFQGSVISKAEPRFEAQTFPQRLKIN